ncbi:MAG: hypothetical protein V5A16_02335 [Haloplanus sp.]
MTDDDVVELVSRSLSADAVEPFRERAEAQADWLRDQLDAGRLDNGAFTVGLELECYAVDATADAPRLARVPDSVFETAGANKELGLHNVEVNTDATVMDEAGLAEQAAEIRERTRAARSAADDVGQELVLDAMFAVPPREGTEAYLGAVAERDGVVFAKNMRQDPRYVAIDNDTLRHTDGDSITLDVPGATVDFPTILFESLATSIQPHLQVPEAADFPAYYNAAIRTMGPLVALSSNSPFLPADLYGEVADPAALVDSTHHELRIAVFEQSVNATPNPKVRVPGDIDDAAGVLDRLLADDCYAPFLREWIEGEESRHSLPDRIWELDHKRGTYWRWLRAVIGGDHVDADNDEYSLRIEYRPLPTQPTITDIVGLQALTAGLVRGLVDADHPITDLPWSAAEASFYDAVEHGLEADLAWITADGERTSDADVIFDEVFAHAYRGLDAACVPRADAERYLAPIEARWAERFTPSMWKKAQVREALADGGDLEAAIEHMQSRYVERSRESDSFAEWL